MVCAWHLLRTCVVILVKKIPTAGHQPTDVLHVVRCRRPRCIFYYGFSFSFGAVGGTCTQPSCGTHCIDDQTCAGAETCNTCSKLFFIITKFNFNMILFFFLQYDGLRIKAVSSLDNFLLSFMLPNVQVEKLLTIMSWVHVHKDLTKTTQRRRVKHRTPLKSQK
jgi:hypothetical protein